MGPTGLYKYIIFEVDTMLVYVGQHHRQWHSKKQTLDQHCKFQCQIKTAFKSFHTGTLRKLNEWGFWPPLGIYRLNWAGEPPEDEEMNGMTLPSTHRI